MNFVSSSHVSKKSFTGLLIDGMSRVVNPKLQYYGKWQFLTFHCLLLQFSAYLLCLVSYFVPSSRLRKFRDFFITTLAWPTSGVVFTIFWGVWHLLGRELIFPAILEEFHPSWLNHAVHTIIVPINLIELYLVRHQYSSTRLSLPILVSYHLGYSLFLLYMKIRSGAFVYEFLNHTGMVGLACTVIVSVITVTTFFFFGKALSKLAHGSSIESSRSTRRHND